MYSWVTPLFEDDLLLVRLQACSMGLMLPPEQVAEILIIDNTTRSGSIPWDTLLAWYGRLADAVEIVPRGRLVPPGLGHGWYGQQLLKMEVARIVKAPNYVVLDAKTHLLEPPPSDFFMRDVKTPRVFIHGYRSHPLLSGVVKSQTFWGVPPDIDAFPALHTPLCLNAALVRDMMAEITNRGRAFPELITEGHLEFPLYWAYLRSRGVPVAQGERYGGIWRGAVMTSDRAVEGRIATIEEERHKFLSLHRAAIPELSISAKGMLQNFWKSRGIPKLVMPFRV